jgi:hypothetical protein
MGDPIKAEAVREHFATVVSPSLAMTPFGRREVPTVPAVSLENALLTARQTNGNSAPLFLLRSTAIDPISGKNFVPGEAIMTNSVESSFATAHGHMGVISGPGLTPVPGAINTGVLTGPNVDCSAEFAGLINALAEQMASEFMRDPLRFLLNFDSAADAATKARLGEYAEKAGNWLSGAWEWTKGAASSTYDYVASGEILDDAWAAGEWVVDAAGNAWDYASSGEILDDIKNGAISVAEGAQALYNFVQDVDMQDVIDACKEWLLEMLEEFQCQLVGLLREMLADPRPMSTKLGEMYGTAKAEVAVTAAQVGAAVVADVLVTKGAASAASRLGTIVRLTGGRMGALSDKIFDRINSRRAGTPKPDADGPSPTPTPTPERAAAAADDTPKQRPHDKDAVEEDANGRANVVCPICP